VEESSSEVKFTKEERYEEAKLNKMASQAQKYLESVQSK